MMSGFRFENLEVWQDARKIVNELMILSGELRQKKQFALADQLFRAALSITNNISEGSGSSSSRDFAHFLNISRRSAFECVNILIHCSDLGGINAVELISWRFRLEGICRQLYAYRKYQLAQTR